MNGGHARAIETVVDPRRGVEFTDGGRMGSPRGVIVGRNCDAPHPGGPLCRCHLPLCTTMNGKIGSISRASRGSANPIQFVVVRQFSDLRVCIGLDPLGPLWGFSKLGTRVRYPSLALLALQRMWSGAHPTATTPGHAGSTAPARPRSRPVLRSLRRVVVSYRPKPETSEFTWPVFLTRVWPNVQVRDHGCRHRF